MNTEFLKGLGISDQSVIDAIFAENGKDINKAKGNVEQLTTQVNDLQTQLSERDSQLKELKKSVKDNEVLTNKITELETANQSAVTEYQNKIASIQKNYAIESSVRDAKAKNAKAVMALLDIEKITFENGELKGISEQLDALSKGEDTAFLFGETQSVAPAGTQPNNPPFGGNGGNAPSGKSFTDAIAAALNSNK